MFSGFSTFLQGNKLQEITGDILQGAANLTELNAGRSISPNIAIRVSSFTKCIL
jgi:hypothetical protein